MASRIKEGIKDVSSVLLLCSIGHRSEIAVDRVPSFACL